MRIHLHRFSMAFHVLLAYRQLLTVVAFVNGNAFPSFSCFLPTSNLWSALLPFVFSHVYNPFLLKNRINRLDVTWSFSHFLLLQYVSGQWGLPLTLIHFRCGKKIRTFTLPELPNFRTVSEVVCSHFRAWPNDPNTLGLPKKGRRQRPWYCSWIYTSKNGQVVPNKYVRSLYVKVKSI